MVEVLDHSPPTLTPVDRLLLTVVAEDCNDATREGWCGWQLIARRMHWSDQVGGGKHAVTKAVAQLASHGVEIRVPMGKDKNGKPIYATRGHRTVYRIPPLGKGANVDHPSVA